MAKTAPCHPEKRYYARGLCANCYSNDWKARHPEQARAIKRREYAKNRSRYLATAKVYYEANVEKIRAKSRDWGRANPERRRTTRLLRDYGVSEADFVALSTAQGGRCAICRVADTLTVDHDHATHRVRGLLCHHCNRALGHLRDNAATARAAADYLERER